jgi:hypothetical protein
MRDLAHWPTEEIIVERPTSDSDRCSIRLSWLVIAAASIASWAAIDAVVRLIS